MAKKNNSNNDSAYFYKGQILKVYCETCKRFHSYTYDYVLSFAPGGEHTQKTEGE